MIFRSEQKTFFISADCVPIFCALSEKTPESEAEICFCQLFFL